MNRSSQTQQTSRLAVTLVGHSTTLLEIGGMTVLTDPYFGRRGNPAYARLAPPALSRDEVGPVDLVLVSHHHWDHVDRRYLRSLDPSVPVLTPKGTTWLARLHGARSAVGIEPWETRVFGSLAVTAVPALHLARTVGFVLGGGGESIYFAGDTYWRPFFRQIGERFDLDVALMPVTTYRLPMTMGEKGALQAARDLGAKLIIPIHLGVAPRLPLLRTGQSPEGFSRRVELAGLPTRVVILREGETWTAPAATEERSAAAVR